MAEFVTYVDRRGRTRRRRKPLRLPGHKLTMRWSGEYGIESSSTGECACGWQESASNQHEVRFEYNMHLLAEQAKVESARTGENFGDVYKRLADAWFGR